MTKLLNKYLFSQVSDKNMLYTSLWLCKKQQIYTTLKEYIFTTNFLLLENKRNYKKNCIKFIIISSLIFQLIMHCKRRKKVQEGMKMQMEKTLRPLNVWFSGKGQGQSFIEKVLYKHLTYFLFPRMKEINKERQKPLLSIYNGVSPYTTFIIFYLIFARIGQINMIDQQHLRISNSNLNEKIKMKLR